MLSVGKSKVADALDSSSGIPTDVTFLVKNSQDGVEKFQAHKLLLSLVSEVFKTRFYGSFGETSDILEIQEIAPQAFETMINFIYHKDCHLDKKSAEEIFEIANVAEMYDIAQLMVEVKRAVKRIPVTMTNVADLAHTAEQFSMFPSVSTTLMRSCVKFLYSIGYQVLDFSGLIFSPHHESIVLKLHIYFMEKPSLFLCPKCQIFSFFDELHCCGLPSGWSLPSDELQPPALCRVCLVRACS